jgi:peroxiredoxin
MLALFCAAALAAQPQAVPLPKVGDPAPDFAMVDQDGRKVTRDSMRGSRVVLAFYHKDFTPG